MSGVMYWEVIIVLLALTHFTQNKTSINEAHVHITACGISGTASID